MHTPTDRLRDAIALLESQRAVLGDEVVELALAPLRERLQAPAAAGQPPAQRLRQLSVLFVDVVGFTHLSQRLTPEQEHDIVDGALGGFTRIAVAHGGQVLQYAGDSLMAVFGDRAAREDDALRAVRAAQAILVEAAARADALQRRHGLAGFGVRAGVASGPVLLGAGVDGEYAARGMTVNLAARMEQTAAPGSLRVCADTWRQVRGLFDGEPERIQVKGVDEPVTTWRVGAPRDGQQAQRGLDGVATPFVGREAERARLMQAHAEVTARRGLRTCVVEGEAGLGKTRLVAQFRAALPPGAAWLTAQAGEGDSERPYGLLRQVFVRHVGLRDSDAAEVQRERWLHALAGLLGSQGDAAVLGQLLGLAFADHPEVVPLRHDARQLRDRGLFHATEALRRLASAAPPLVLQLDDLQWADAGTLEWITQLQQQAADAPLLLLLLTRPADPAAGWRQRAEVLGLSPLSASAASRLADALLTASAAAERERVLDAAAGNPFFLEELAHMLHERRPAAAPADAALPLPATLAGVLQARLDGLDADEARLIEAAAVVGPVFWDDALVALGLNDGAALARLLRRHLVVALPHSSLEGRREFAFRHQLLHQACYERLLQRDRVAAHARVAQWLEQLPGDKPHERIALHLERGGEPARAALAWQRAAEAAQSRYANTQALAHADRVLALTAGDAVARRWAPTLLRAQVLGLIGQNEARGRELDALQQLAQALDDPARRAEAAHARANWLLDRGAAAEALEAAESACRLAPADAPQIAARAGLSVVHALQSLGRHGALRERAQAVLDVARRAGDRRIEGAILNALGLCADDLGDIGAAVALYRQALDCHRGTGNRSHEAGVLSNLGYAELGLGHYAEAGERFEEARAQFARIGQREKEAVVVVNQALAALNAGQPAQALTLALQALAALEAAASHAAAAAAIRIAGQASLVLGDTAAAVDRLADARERFAALSLQHLATEAGASLALALQAAGDGEAALAQAQAVWAALRDTGVEGTEEPLRVYLDCWQVLHAAAHPQAPAVLAEGHALLLRRAALLADGGRREAYLQRVPHHRALLDAVRSAA